MTHTVELTTAELLHLRIFRSGKNQREVAEMLGVSTATLSRIVRGKRKPTTRLRRLISLRFRIVVASWA